MNCDMDWPDATALAERVRAGDVSALEATEAAIARSEMLEPRINAYASERYEKARAEAAALDADPDRKADAPFAGAPFLVKDLAALNGAPLTFGSRLFRDFKAPRTEPIIQGMLDAGMVALGKSNTPEFGLIGTTEPLLHGPTCNPWDEKMSAGGSSGGAAAAVAAGMVPIAHATDGGGSIRIPASACGLFGLKPSRGRGLPPMRSAPGGLSTSFCVSRSVRDSARLMAFLDQRRLERAGDDHPGPAELGLIEAPIDRPLRIGLTAASAQGLQPDAEVAAALQATAQLCESLGHKVDEAELVFDGEEAAPHFIALWAAIPEMLTKKFSLLRAVAHGWRVWDWPSYENALDPWTRGLVDWLAARRREIAPHDPLVEARSFFRETSRRYEQSFERYDVILSPVMRRACFPIGEQAPSVPFDTLLERASDNVGYTPLHNAIGAPAMSVPLGWTASGFPIGMQFAARRHDERTLLELAYQLEQAAPWSGRRPELAAA